MKIESKNGIEPLFKYASILFTVLYFALPLNYLDKKKQKNTSRMQELIFRPN
jgi:hypothetical protein